MKRGWFETDGIYALLGIGPHHITHWHCAGVIAVYLHKRQKNQRAYDSAGI